MSELVLVVGSKRYIGWESIDVTISMQTLSGLFALSISDNITADNKPIKKLPDIIPGMTCQVLIADQTVITGYIDKVMPMMDANVHTIVVQGRDRTCDLVDCTMIQDSNQWKSITVDKIIDRICKPFGIPVIVEAPVGKAIDSFLVEQGSTCFEVIQKLCYMRQLLAISNGKGGLILTTSGRSKTNTAIIEGQNIKRGQATYDFSERFNKYICKGQRQGDDTTSNDPTVITGSAGEYTDNAITRYRPLAIIAEGQSDIKACQERARWEGAIRRGKSRSLTFEVNGWQQGNGDIWTINKLVTVRSQLLAVNDELLIDQVNYRLDEGGEISTITVTSRESFTVIDKGKDKSNAYAQLVPQPEG